MAQTVVKKIKNNQSFLQKVYRSRVLLLMCAPAMLFFFLFSYMPLPGIWVAFVKYNYRDGIFGSKFVGLNNFEFLINSGKLFELTKNTILYNLTFIILGNLLAVFVAVLLNEIRNKKIQESFPNGHVFALLHFSGSGRYFGVQHAKLRYWLRERNSQ